jgi:hypothetical protein
MFFRNSNKLSLDNRKTSLYLGIVDKSLYNGRIKGKSIRFQLRRDRKELRLRHRTETIDFACDP